MSKVTGERKPKSRANRDAEQLYHILTQAIVEQALAPETRLIERDICEQFNISRHAVRTAFQMLASDDLVEIRQNKGVTIAKPSMEHGVDVLRIRMELEDIVVRYLSGNLTEAQVKELRASVEHEHEFVHKDHTLYMRHACEFHRKLAKMTKSKVLAGYLNPLFPQSSLILYLYGRPNWNQCNIEEHLAIINALEADEKARARELMRTHLEAMFQRAFTDSIREETISLTDVLASYAKLGGPA
ncbi:GntR family transcriptional regulator [Pontibaca salina]|uniref:GntR family transcriptional regulator n=1 Tax=Pontibaca salina TaxID=2795731 RepID=A0A934M438_9RHOB|nr:GntR family transcriptional regulator [Pontibaca salina]MBI6630494.1 GntR family transcriptional regulator [Pontibaca salina]